MFLATFALFVVSLGYGVVVPALPRLAGRGDASAAASELSLVCASYAAAKIAAQIPGGVWVDRKGPRVVLEVALIVYVVSLLGLLLPLGPGWFAVVRAIEGLATGLVYPAVFARVLLASGDDHAGRRIGTAVGIGSSGLLIGPVLGATLGKDGPLAPIGIAAALGVLVLVAAFIERFGGQVERAGGAVARTTAGEVSRLVRLARDGAFVLTMLPVAFNKLTFSAYQGLLPLLGASDLKLGRTGIALLFVLIGVVFAAAQPIGGALVDRAGARRVVLLGLPVLIGALAVLAVPSGASLFAVAFGIHIFAQSIVFTATMKRVAHEHASASTYGGVFGLLSTFTDTMTVIGPLVFLNVYGLCGRNTFAIMAAVGLAWAIPFSWRLRASSGGSARGSGTG